MFLSTQDVIPNSCPTKIQMEIRLQRKQVKIRMEEVTMQVICFFGVETHPAAPG